jgi:phospholipid/cholesterol/gamma-HCH transport system permease protein
LRSLPVPPAFTNHVGRKLFVLLQTAQGLGAFSLITLGVIFRQRGQAREIMQPRIRREITRSGSRLLPVFSFMALALGFLVVGQAVSQLSTLGATSYVGSLMVTVVVRELGPLLAVMMMLARVGSANVIELGMARAGGEVEALEALAIDPVHYLVVPRVLGMAAGVFALTIYLILGALGGGYLWAFLMLPHLQLTPGQYVAQIADALNWMDFVLMTVKTLTFGFFIAVITCYHGLAQPLRLEDVSRVAVQAVTQGIVVCTLLDLVFIVLYFVG